MKIDDIYEEIRSILKEPEISDEESGEMIDYLEENAAESGLDAEEYIRNLGSPEQVADDFMTESKRLREYRQDQLPPLPNIQKPEEKEITEEKLETEQYEYGPLSEDRIPENYLKEEAEEQQNFEQGGSDSFSGRKNDQTDDPFRKTRIEPVDHSQGAWYSISPDRFERLRKIHVSLTNGFCRIRTGNDTGVRILEGERYISVTIKKDKIVIEQNPAAFLPFIRDRKGLIEITVPDHAVFEKIHSDSVNMSFEGEGLQAEKIHLETVNGSLILRDSAAEKISLSSTNGTLEASGCGFRKLSAESVNGQILLDADPAMKVIVETVSGKIIADEPFAMSIQKEIVGTNLRYSPQYFSESEKGKVSVQNVSGEIRIGCRK